MNDIRNDRPDDGSTGLDPDLIRLFDEALAPESSEAFIATVLVEVRKARRARLFARAILTAVIIALAAFLAPYVAQATLTVMGSAALYPVVCVCAALLAWRTAHRRLN